MVIGNHILINGDCLEVMPTIESGSVDMILCDLPYGTTACRWDVIIPFDKLWKEYERIIKPNGAIVLTASQPFTSALVMSNPKLFKYQWVWVKSKALGFTNAKNKPMNKHEDVLVFSKGTTANKSERRMEYYPQGLKPYFKIVSGVKACNADATGHKFARPSHKAEHLQEYTNYPTTLLEFPNEGNTTHPTQKPVALFEYLIKTYTNEGETVLDNCAGSFTTAVACENTGRKSICIEREEKYFNIGVERVRNIQPTLFKKAV